MSNNADSLLPRLPESGSVTMADVARATGLSRTTLSKYFNNRPGLKPKTRARIEEACAALQYLPDMHAVSLVKGRSNLIGVIVPVISEPFFSKLLEVFEHEAAQLGLQLIIQCSNNDIQREASALQALRAIKVQGLMIAAMDSSHNAALLAQLEREMRVVYVDAYVHPACNFVMNDNCQSIGIVVDYVARQGRRPAYLGAPKIANPSRPERLQGYLAAMEKLHLEPEIIVPANDIETWDFETYAYACVTKWLNSGNWRTRGVGAIVCATDRLALGAMKAIRDAGLEPGKDLLLTGHDDLSICDYLQPPLTSLRQDIEGMARAALHCLLAETAADTAFSSTEKLSGADVPETQPNARLFQKRFPARLVERQSA